uniref:Flavin-containing monooxygenase n=1 Tax=Ditylenchus dipsaci TaxID=166011 RepID=A0A915D4I2_9BILA
MMSSYGPVDKLNTKVFFAGLDVAEETNVEIEQGKTLVIQLLAKGKLNERGEREVFFEMNGQLRQIYIQDKEASKDMVVRPKAVPGVRGSIGARCLVKFLNYEDGNELDLAQRDGHLLMESPSCFRKVPRHWRHLELRKNQFNNSTMKTTVLNTTKEMSAFSDCPPPKHFANYMHNTSYLQYLSLLKSFIRGYCETHDLLPHIQLEHEVTQIKRADDYALTGRWLVEYTDSKGNSTRQVFDCVVMAVGHNFTPNIPSWPDQHLFTGAILHSKDYKVPTKQFEDKVNLVVELECQRQILQWS